MIGSPKVTSGHFNSLLSRGGTGIPGSPIGVLLASFCGCGAVGAPLGFAPSFEELQVSFPSLCEHNNNSERTIWPYNLFLTLRSILRFLLRLGYYNAISGFLKFVKLDIFRDSLLGLGIHELLSLPV